MINDVPIPELDPCPEWRIKIHDFLNETLSEEEVADLQQHVEACGRCQEYFRLMNVVDEGFRRHYEQQDDGTQ